MNDLDKMTNGEKTGQRTKKAEIKGLVSSDGEQVPDYSMEKILHLPKEEVLELLWSVDPHLHKVLRNSNTLHAARDSLFRYLNRLERSYFNIYADQKFKRLHSLEKNLSKECIRILKNVIRSENEKLTRFSTLDYLWKLARGHARQLNQVSRGFLSELIFLILGINGKLYFYQKSSKPPLIFQAGKNPGLARSHFLDQYSKHVRPYLRRYHSGLEPGLTAIQREVRRRIMDHFGADPSDWKDYRWHLRHILRGRSSIEAIVELSEAEREGLDLAEMHGVPFQVTPYYLSLFNPEAGTGRDTAIRAQVLPGKKYVTNFIQAQESGEDLDFMGEQATSPIEGITRRYPQVLILKAFESCPQICVYCQRNWEIKGISDTRVRKSKLRKAIEWIADNESIEEVLVTGGDPLTLGDETLKPILESLAAIDHLDRIRLSTRVPVTLPYRITDELVGFLSGLNDFGKREVCFVTHIESPLELTPDSLEAIKRIRAGGMSIYNQQVFTYHNSRRFETFFLRKMLKRCGVDPYYCFNTKGKDETLEYRVPIARLEQERKEEARLLPGLVRTDEPVFNVPTIGKSHLRAWQDHEIIMILPDGRRVYRFYPWESMLALSSPYVYTDVSIYHYLKRLLEDGENVDDYSSIWYYF